jgi:hypothetical protein
MFVDSRVDSGKIPTGATVAPIPIPITCKARRILNRLRQTFLHVQLASVNLALIPDLKHFLEASVCSDKTIQLRSLCLPVRCIRHDPILHPFCGAAGISGANSDGVAWHTRRTSRGRANRTLQVAVREQSWPENDAEMDELLEHCLCPTMWQPVSLPLDPHRRIVARFAGQPKLSGLAQG